ncbi:hypothetical protein N7481_003310 [Penicillium waksmanii]|uniref:uncharacterized protein n=1 Tax=Penicillium waksmanii TaxID=69791 RepID=UPI00254862E9|nr:uncharacterized protein N7481_003310 [Penicillium waksmanii]KAJ5988100.1 hypothetical protein N7481_003310 [Penicillium waksmanii]
MEPYWSGFTSPIAFPVYTGAKGVSTGTQYPAGYSTPSSTTSDSDSGSGSSADSNSNSASYIMAHSSGTAVSNISQHRGNSTPVGSIVGGVIGGLVFISLSVGVSVYFADSSERKESRSGAGITSTSTTAWIPTWSSSVSISVSVSAKPAYGSVWSCENRSSAKSSASTTLAV